MTSAEYAQLLADVQPHVFAGGSLNVVRRSDQPTVVPHDSRAEWTNALLNSLATAGRGRGLVVQPTRLYFSRDHRGQGHNSKKDRPIRQDDVGEFITDLAWWSPVTGPWWDQPPAVVLTPELLVESEWGWMEGGDVDYHCGVVARDYAKLLFARARGRLFLTSCLSADLNRFQAMLTTLRERAGLQQHDVAVWLWDHDATQVAAGTPTVLFP